MRERGPVGGRSAGVLNTTAAGDGARWADHGDLEAGFEAGLSEPRCATGREPAVGDADCATPHPTLSRSSTSADFALRRH